MPEIDPRYRAGAAAGQLRVQQCPICRFLRFPPASLCPRCLTPSDEWVAISGRGVIWSWIRMHRQYFADGRRPVPYTVVMVQLNEGPMMISAIEGRDDGLRCGQPVTAVAADDGSGPLPRFRLATAAEG